MHLRDANIIRRVRLTHAPLRAAVDPMYVPLGNLHAYVTYSELLGECVTTNSL